MSEPTIDAIRRAIADRRGWAIDTLSEWVRFDSVLGREEPAQQWAASVFEDLGLEVRLQDVDIDAIRDLPGFSPVDWDYAGRPNLVGLHRARRREGRSLIFNGHVDVVSPEPTSLWSSLPFEARVLEQEDGTWLRGRGAADMKGGSVCHLWALAALRDLGFVPAADVIVQSPIEEECTGNGTLALCASGYRADACIIPEPFDEQILLEQIGVLWFRIRVLGKTTHVLGAGGGVNAIEKSWLLMRAMRELEEVLNAPDGIPPGYRGVEHPINLNVGVIEGGDWPSTVPGECLVRYRLGLFPEQSCAELMSRVEQKVREVAASDPWLRENPPQVEWVGFRAEGCRLDADEPLIQTLSAAHEALHGEAPKHLRATCTTDARFFLLHYGIPATCYGPIGRAFHAADERVSIDSMERVAAVMADLVRRWCGLLPRAVG